MAAATQLLLIPSCFGLSHSYRRQVAVSDTLMTPRQEPSPGSASPGLSVRGQSVCESGLKKRWHV